MKKKYILTFIALCMTVCAFGATACKSLDDPDRSSQSENNEEVVIPSIAFTERKIEMLVGETRQLSLANLEDGETVTYTTNDASVVSVSENGVVEGKAVGTAVVKAMSNTGRSGLIEIVVYDPETYPIPCLSLKQDNIALFVGDEFAVTYTYTYLGETIDGTVQMNSDNTLVATVENGMIRAIGVGTANVLVKVNSSHGEVAKNIKVNVTEKQTEFYPSFVGKDVCVGNSLTLVMYANENGEVKTVDNVTFTVADTDIAMVEDGMLIPLTGGDTTIACVFEYGGENYEKVLPIHIYGPHTCSFTYTDGSVDYTVDALYGDIIPLVLKNPKNNPEYNKPIKRWYVNGKAVEEEYFVMPDEDVEVSVRFINETEDNFEKSFTNGYLLNNLAAKIQYIEEPLTDEKGNVSNFDGYMKFSTNSYGSLIYQFDEEVKVNEYATIRIRLYVTEDSPLLYFGIPSEEKWPEDSSSPEYEAKKGDKKYEASASGHSSGDVPCIQLSAKKWTVLEMPLSAFANVGEELSGISMAAASIAIDGAYDRGGEFFIDYISLNYGYFATDVGYQDNYYYDAILAEENGSEAQAAAIGEYYRWALTLSEDKSNSQTHQANVASIKALMKEYFTQTHKNLNDPVVTGAHDAGNNHNGATGYHTAYKTTYETFHVVQFSNASNDGKITLGKTNYNACQETYFGLFAITTGNGAITIDGQTFSFDSSKEHFFKVFIQDGVLTLTDDSQANNDGGATVLTVSLSKDILSGMENLVIDCQFDAWSQVEITEMYSTECLVTAVVKNIPTVNGGAYRGDQNLVGMGNVHTAYKTSYNNFYMTQFGTAPYTGTFTFNKVNYNACTEVSFGLYAISTGNGVITIGDKSFSFDSSKEHYFKLVIMDGILMLTDDSKTNTDGGATVIKVELSEDILNGTEALVINFQFTGWSQVENTDMYYKLAIEDII